MEPGPSQLPHVTSSPTPSRCRRLGPALILLLLATTCWAFQAVRLAWVSDDAFISFRCAESLVNRSGLVFNAGEQVEVYTNFLWTMVIAGALKVGVPAEEASIVLGALSHLALVAAVLWMGSFRQRQPIPLAALLLLLLDDFQIWSTGGLETSFFTLLSVLGVLVGLREPRTTWSSLGSGVLLGLAVLTRPDGLIFAVVGLAGALVIDSKLPGRRRIALALSSSLPVMLLVTAHIVFKLTYYGRLLPTTFYAKSAYSPYYSQGLIYVGLFFAKHWVIPVSLLLLASLSRRHVTALFSTRQMTLGAAFLAFALYVVHSGGDFMFSRRLLPALPFLFLMIEEGFVAVEQRGGLGQRGRRSLLLLAVAIASLFPIPVYSADRQRIRGISNEHTFYPLSQLRLRRRQAEFVGKALRGSGARIGIGGGLCALAYYSKLPYFVEMDGLTHYSLAEKALKQRGIVGHEKKPTRQWLVDHRIHLILSERLPPFPPADGRAQNGIRFGEEAMGMLVFYDDRVMNHLRRDPSVRFVPIEHAIADAKKQIGRSLHPKAVRVYEMLDAYYFQPAGAAAQPLAREMRAMVEARPGALNR